MLHWIPSTNQASAQAQDQAQVLDSDLQYAAQFAHPEGVRPLISVKVKWDPYNTQPSLGTQRDQGQG